MGCGEKISKRDIIPEKDLIPILVDIHIADGILGIPSILKRFPGKDSLSNYQNLMQSHGYTLTDLNRTIQYYSRKPDRLEVIYDKVQNKLSEMESEIRNQRSPIPDFIKKDTLWNQKTEWHLPADGLQESIPFSIPINEPGIYTLKTRLRVFPDDESLNPRVTAYFWFDDGSKLGHREYFPAKKIPKMGVYATYTLSSMEKNKEITHLKGWILDHSTNKAKGWSKHADVMSITVDFKPLPLNIPTNK